MNDRNTSPNRRTRSNLLAVLVAVMLCTTPMPMAAAESVNSTTQSASSSPHAPAAAPYPDRTCTWQLDNGLWPSTLNVWYANSQTARPSGTSWVRTNFAPSSTRDGRIYSFFSRMSEAVSHLNTKMASTGAGERSGFDLTYQGGPTQVTSITRPTSSSSTAFKETMVLEC